MPTIDRKKMILAGFAIVAAVIDQIAGTNFLPSVLQAIMGM